VTSALVVSLVIAVALTQVATFSTTIYLHRSATHRALTLHPAIAWLFRFAPWITTGLARKEWVAVHRKHVDGALPRTPARSLAGPLPPRSAPSQACRARLPLYGALTTRTKFS
jgi:hypothetical protein